METENAESAPYYFSLFYKTKKKKSFVDIRSESEYTNNRPTCFFSVNIKLKNYEFIFVVFF